MEWELEDVVMVLFTGREEPRDGFEQKVQVIGKPRFLYFEETNFLYRRNETAMDPEEHAPVF